MKVKIALVMSAVEAQRQHDRPVDAQMPAAVDAGGLVQLARQVAHELDHEEDEERLRGQVLAEQQRHIGVDELRLLEHHVLRDEQYVIRQQEGADHQREEDVAVGEADPGEGVGGERAGDQDADDGTARVEEGVLEEGPDGDVGDAVGQAGEVREDGVGREEAEAVEDVLARLERGPEEPDDGVEDDGEDEQRADVPDEGAGASATGGPGARGAYGVGGGGTHRASSSSG